MTNSEKTEALKRHIGAMQSVAVAFSGGVDSSFLLKIAHDVLKERSVAVTVLSAFVPERERLLAKRFCEEHGIRQICIEVNPLEIPGVRENPKNRCYLCKREIFGAILETARSNGFDCVADGTNADDALDYRPGLLALRELEIQSPLGELGFSKEDIRDASRKMGLETWAHPSFACLASRFAYGESLTKERLRRVENAEDFFLANGLEQIRVRVHGNLARIEVLPADMEKVFSMRKEIVNKLMSIGFDYVTLDLFGFRSGSMNVPIGGGPNGKNG